MDREAVLVIAITFGSLTTIIFGVLYGIRKYGERGEAVLDRIYAECGFPCEPGPGHVEIVYPTCHGILVGVRQQTHVVLASEERAIELLRRLRNFNLTWGILAYGGLFTILLTFVNYAIQLREIRKQVLAGEAF